MSYASFWKRTAAYLVDGIIYDIISSVIGQIIGFVLGVSMGFTSAGQSQPSLSAMLIAVGIVLCVQFVCYLAYYVWPESSSWQATIGKKIFGLKVTDLNGQRISFWRSLGRNLGMIISSIILGIGYLMCIWTDKKQCLHDRMAGCLVTDETPQEKRGCAIAVVIAWVVLVGLVVAGIVAAIAIPGVIQYTERAHSTEAKVFLQQAQSLQQMYRQEHGTYATKWNQFELPVVESKNLCLTPDQTCTPQQKFQVALDRKEVKALRINTKEPYGLSLSYAPQGQVTCVAPNAQTCQRLGF